MGNVVLILKVPSKISIADNIQIFILFFGENKY